MKSFCLSGNLLQGRFSLQVLELILKELSSLFALKAIVVCLLSELLKEVLCRLWAVTVTAIVSTSVLRF